MKLLIQPNGYTRVQAEHALAFLASLESQGHECALAKTEGDLLRRDDRWRGFSSGDCDIVVSLGGDGCVLRAAQTALSFGKPLLGINAGRLGYLCAGNLSDGQGLMEILSDSVLTERLILEFDYQGRTYYAVNDVVFAKKNFGETADLYLTVDHSAGVRIRGDGVILSTPTGSTAYNLSSGGPVLDLDSDVFLMTPICPHASSVHPTVLAGNRVASVRERDKRAQIYADGVFLGELSEEVCVRRSPRKLLLYTRKSHYGNIFGSP